YRAGSAEQQMDAKQAAELRRKIRKNRFEINKSLDQLQQIKKMGNIKDLMGMIPGMGKAIKDVDLDNDSFKGIEAIIQSMTPYEREHPEIINGPRRQRIARGSGNDIAEVNKLLKQFEEMRKMMKMMNNPSKMAGLMRTM